MQHDPPDPRQDALELESNRRLQHRVATTDRRHGALVAIVKGLGLQSAMQPGDLPSGKLAHLESRLRQLWQWAVNDHASVADREDSFLTHHPRIVVDLDSAGPADRQSPVAKPRI